MNYNNFINLSQEEFQKQVYQLNSEEQSKLLEHLEQVSPKKTVFVNYWWLLLSVCIGLIAFANTFTNHTAANAVVFLCIVGIMIIGALNLSYHGRIHIATKANFLKNVI
jgi:uncharacterized membrane protein (Fun14 family)